MTICDVANRKSIERQALAATLDTFAVGLIIVSEEHRILYANRAAVRMFAGGRPVRSMNGCLSTRDAAVIDRLGAAIALARCGDAEPGCTGIGIALGSAPFEPAIAHVFPLARGELGTRLAPRSSSAVLVVPADTPPIISLAAVADALGLTPSEARLVEKLAAGATLAEAAVALGIAGTTAMTHLTRIFCKTKKPGRVAGTGRRSLFAATSMARR